MTLTTKVFMKMVIAVTLAMLPVLATACGNIGDNNGNNGNNDGVKQQGTVRQQANTNNANDRIQVADRASEKIAAIPAVEQANVLVTQRNAYVAAVLDDTRDRLSRKIEDQIAAKVRETDPGIQNVYVSTNPDFVARINTYVREVRQGRPVAGFVEEFNEMVQRIFPNAR